MLSDLKTIFINSFRIIFTYFLVLVLILCIRTDSYSQNLYFQSYTTSEGLSQNSIYSIAETPEGFMWFGTQDGINRFDGKKFKSIKPNIPGISGESYSFSKMITALFHDQQDQLWVGTTKELLIYNRYRDRFNYPKEIYKGFNIPSHIWFKKIIEDHQQNIWIITQDDGIYCYNKVKMMMKKMEWSGSVPKKMINIIIDKSDNIWLATPSEIYRFADDRFIPVKMNLLIGKQNFSIADICFVDSSLWVVIDNSEIFMLNVNDPDKIGLTPFNHVFRGKKMLADIRIIHQSDENTVWVGSRSDGVLKIDLNSKKYINSGIKGSSYSLKSQFVLSFYTNKQSITWVGLSGAG
ncbi:MAG: hypothetical protein H7X99_05725, partial [Saprospiraceae bacterium]|nr:hypothetical protein [Saprospiraceae bacterium]